MWRKTVYIIDTIARVASNVANYISAAFLFLLMLLTCGDVTLRYLFNKPITGSLELTEFMMAIIVSLALAYCALKKGHVRVDLIVSKLPKRVQLIMESIANIAFLAFVALMTWRIIYRAWQMVEVNQITAILRIPVFPFVLVVAAGTTVLCIVLLKNIIGNLDEVAKK
jgi:TRAP-type C4-dicarboxylate transport system permease small subunit